MAHTSAPKPLYDAAITYRTPSGRRVRFYAKPIAADTLADCEAIIRERLANEDTHGRRRVATIVGEFTATFMGHQIGRRGEA